MDNQVLLWGMTVILVPLAIVNLIFDVRHPNIKTATWQKLVSSVSLIGWILSILLNYGYQTYEYSFLGTVAALVYLVMNSPFVKGPLAKKRAQH